MRADQRNYPRVQLKLPVSYVVKNSKIYDSQTGTTQDISVNGLKIKSPTANKLTAGDEITGKIIPPNKIPISFTAQVIWSHDMTCRLRFTQLSRLERKKIDELMSGVMSQML